jgi:hypothetical protein
MEESGRNGWVGGGDSTPRIIITSLLWQIALNKTTPTCPRFSFFLSPRAFLFFSFFFIKKGEWMAYCFALGIAVPPYKYSEIKSKNKPLRFSSRVWNGKTQNNIHPGPPPRPLLSTPLYSVNPIDTQGRYDMITPMTHSCTNYHRFGLPMSTESF